MKEELLKKLIEERPLTAEESLLLDDALGEKNHVAIAAAVHDLPTAEPSLAWRSSLNERLAKTHKARRRVIWIWGSATATLAATAALFVIIAVQSRIPTNPKLDSPSVEEVIVSVHREDVATPPEQPATNTDSSDWVDVETL